MAPDGATSFLRFEVLHMSALFSPLALRSVTLPNRIAMSPMCQYMATDGIASPWHLVHLGSRAVGGTGLVIAEATAVEPAGRLTPGCLGLWSPAHAEALRPVTDFISSQGSVPAIQLAHGGRKSARNRPWEGNDALPPDASWPVYGPSAIPFGDYQRPHEMTDADLDCVELAFTEATRLAYLAGFRLLTLHFAHGYLMHSFYSPLTNRRTDEWGGDPDRRLAYPLRVLKAIRAAWPDELPLSVRLSCEDWVAGGFGPDDAVGAASKFHAAGADLIECSSAGLVAEEQVSVFPGYHLPFSRRIRSETHVPTAAIGVIFDARQAEAIIAEGAADVIMMARAQLDDPYWAHRAAEELGEDSTWPLPYRRAVRRLRGFQKEFKTVGQGQQHV
ncbi:NADH:flavin oxidoreductase/NADH oxidase [Neorhizobium sp. DT-125]|uniref:NADH:flavin oxidoreductase/NADH oxidase n=1 Tax=Neorhizobium sp. DT-125 TaxID=3396163 RepID=UPI003F1CCEC9